MTLHDDINALRKRLDSAQLEATRAEGAHEHARQVAETAREELKAEFDVDTADEALALLEELRTQLEHQVAQINAQLDGIGVAP